MRHAEGTHQTNVLCKVNFDNELTSDGMSQAVGAKECLKIRDDWDLAATGWNKRPAFPDAIFSSFLVRAIQTANYAFEHRNKSETPLGGVKVADYISENGYSWQDAACFKSSSCPWTPKKQFNDCVGTGRRRTGRCSGFCCGPNTCGDWSETKCSDYLKSKLDWSWLGLSGTPPDSYKRDSDDSKAYIHAPNWHNFLVWLWSHEPIRGLVRDGGGLIGIVSHSEFMKDEVLPSGWNKADNVEIYRGDLEVDCDAGGATGFKMQKPANMEIIGCRRRESTRRRR